MAEERSGFAGFEDLATDLSDLPPPPPSFRNWTTRSSITIPVPPGAAAGIGRTPNRHARRLPLVVMVIGFGGAVGLGIFSGLRVQPSSVAPRDHATFTLPAPQSYSAGPTAQSYAPAAPAAAIEEKPPVGQGATLSGPQARYCLAQGIRVDGAYKAMNSASQAEVKRFLTLEDDYDSRCRNYHFALGVMASVTEEVLPKRAALELEGAALLRAPDDEEKPPVDMAQGAALSGPQVRYCLAQSIRIQGAGKAVNEASKTEVTRFLALADDYKPRCSNSRLQTGFLPSVKAEVESRRAALEREGAALIRMSVTGQR